MSPKHSHPFRPSGQKAGGLVECYEIAILILLFLGIKIFTE